MSSVRIQNASTDNAAPALGLGSGNGGSSEDALAVRRPANANAIQVGDSALDGPVTAVTRGGEGIVSLIETNFSSQFSLLNNKTDFSLLAVP